VDIIRTAYYIHGRELMKLIFAVLYEINQMMPEMLFKNPIKARLQLQIHPRKKA